MEKPFDADQRVPFDDEAPSVPDVHVQVAEGTIRWHERDDFIPNPRRKRGKSSRKNQGEEQPVFLENAEFRTHDDHLKIVKKRNAKILSLAKEIYASKKLEIARFENALKIVKKASRKHKADPDPSLANAMIIVEKGRPMTKKRALERARKEIAGQERLAELVVSEDSKGAEE